MTVCTKGPHPTEFCFHSLKELPYFCIELQLVEELSNNDIQVDSG